jgi:hypothetical protein
MGPFQQALDHSLKTYFINGLYLESIYKVKKPAFSPLRHLRVEGGIPLPPCVATPGFDRAKPSTSGGKDTLHQDSIYSSTSLPTRGFLHQGQVSLARSITCKPGKLKKAAGPRPER